MPVTRLAIQFASLDPFLAYGIVGRNPDPFDERHVLRRAWREFVMPDFWPSVPSGQLGDAHEKSAINAA
jgi:hypothetical protein